MSKIDPPAPPVLSARNRSLNTGLAADGLDAAAALLDAQGYVVLGPDRAGALAGRLGEALEVQLAKTAEGRRTMLLREGGVFEEAVTLPPVLELAEYVCGHGFILSQVSGFYARNDGDGRGGELQSDYYLVREPFPPYGLRASGYFAPDGMSEADGAVWIVPGSHRNGRHPMQPLAPDTSVTSDGVRQLHTPAGDQDPPIPIECAPGSVVVVHGAGWSAVRGPAGSRRRILRCEYGRMFLRPVDDYEDLVEEFARRNDRTLGNLLGAADAFGDNKHTGPDYPKLAASRTYFRT